MEFEWRLWHKVSKYLAWLNSPQWTRASSVLMLHTFVRHTTVGRTPLVEGSGLRRDLYLTHNTPCTGAVRTRNPSKRPAADPRLRPRCHWDRQSHYTYSCIIHILYMSCLQTRGSVHFYGFFSNKCNVCPISVMDLLFYRNRFCKKYLIYYLLFAGPSGRAV